MPAEPTELTFAEWKAIRDLVAAYAHHAERREPRGAGRGVRRGRQVRLIQQCDATTYPNGQSTIAVDGYTASGESYCLAHHLTQEQGERVLIVMAIRYLDTFRRTDEGWRIARRDLVFNWSDRRPSRP